MPTHAETLIARVRELGHSDAEIARRVGVTRGQIANLASGRDKLSPELAALLADLCGADPQEAAARQMVENAKEPRRSMLERVLFTFGALGVAFASLGTPTATDAKPSEEGQITDRVGIARIYIVMRFVAGWLLLWAMAPARPAPFADGLRPPRARCRA